MADNNVLTNQEPDEEYSPIAVDDLDKERVKLGRQGENETQTVQIDCNENKKAITVKMPESRILSNELDENSFKVYQEDESVWNQITLTDSKDLRDQIKKQAEKNAIDNKLLDQASEKAEQLVQSIIFATPGIKETYTVKFEAAK